jgi:hypothetical protein
MRFCKKLLVLAVVFAAFSSMCPSRPLYAASGNAVDLGLEAIRLCIDLGPGAPLSLVEQTLGEPIEKARVGLNVFVWTFDHKGANCQIMLEENGKNSMGAGIWIDAEKFGMTGEDLLDAILNAAKPTYGETRISDRTGKPYFSVKSKYMGGQGGVDFATEGEVVRISQTLF